MPLSPFAVIDINFIVRQLQ